MTTVTQGTNSAYSFNAGESVTVTIVAANRARVSVSDFSGRQKYGEVVVNTKTIGPFNAGDVMSITAVSGDVNYDIISTTSAATSFIGPRSQGVGFDDAPLLQATIDLAYGRYLQTGRRQDWYAVVGENYQIRTGLIARPGVNHWWGGDTTTYTKTGNGISSQSVTGVLVNGIPTTMTFTNVNQIPAHAILSTVVYKDTTPATPTYFGQGDDIGSFGGVWIGNDADIGRCLVDFLNVRRLKVDGMKIILNNNNAGFAFRCYGIDIDTNGIVVTNGQFVGQDGLHDAGGNRHHHANFSIHSGDDSLVVGTDPITTDDGLTSLIEDIVTSDITFSNGYTDSKSAYAIKVFYPGNNVDAGTNRYKIQGGIVFSNIVGRAGQRRNGCIGIYDSQSTKDASRVTGVTVDNFDLYMGDPTHDELNTTAIRIEGASNIRVKGKMRFDPSLHRVVAHQDAYFGGAGIFLDYTTLLVTSKSYTMTVNVGSPGTNYTVTIPPGTDVSTFAKLFAYLNTAFATASAGVTVGLFDSGRYIRFTGNTTDSVQGTLSVETGVASLVGASITGGNTLNVPAVPLGGLLYVGSVITNGGSTVGTISAFGTGTGGAGTYTVTGGVNTAATTLVSTTPAQANMSTLFTSGDLRFSSGISYISPVHSQGVFYRFANLDICDDIDFQVDATIPLGNAGARSGSVGSYAYSDTSGIIVGASGVRTLNRIRLGGTWQPTASEILPMVIYRNADLSFQSWNVGQEGVAGTPANTPVVYTSPFAASSRVAFVPGNKLAISPSGSLLYIGAAGRVSRVVIVGQEALFVTQPLETAFDTYVTNYTIADNYGTATTGFQNRKGGIATITSGNTAITVTHGAIPQFIDTAQTGLQSAKITLTPFSSIAAFPTPVDKASFTITQASAAPGGGSSILWQIDTGVKL